MRRTIVDTARLDAIYLGKKLGLVRSVGGRGVILRLRNVHGPKEQPLPWQKHLSISVKQLEDAIALTQRMGLTPVSLSALPALLSDPNDTRNFVVFTLDHAYHSAACYGLPVLQRHRIPVTMFLCSGFVERKRTMWWETASALVEKLERVEIDLGLGKQTLDTGSLNKKKVAYARLARFVGEADEDVAVSRIDNVARKAGLNPYEILDHKVLNLEEIRQLADGASVTIGAQGVSHVNLRKVTSHRLTMEVRESAQAIYRFLGHKPQVFAYPYGCEAAVTQREIELLARAGARVCVTAMAGMIDVDPVNGLASIPRVTLDGRYPSSRHLEAMLTRGYQPHPDYYGLQET